MLPRINTSLLKILFVVLLIGRFLLDFFGNWREGECLPYSFSLPADRPWAKSVIPDDREIGRSAYFYIHDHKYLIDVSNDRPKFRKEAIWPSAFRNRYHILYEVFLIKVHERFYGPVVIEADHNLSLSYLSLYAEVLFFLKWLSKLLAVYFLYKGARLFFSSGVSLLFLIAWELYPSNFYILHLTALDNIVVHICIIIVGLSLLLAVEKKPDYKKVIALGLFSCLGFTLKFHVLAITFSICLFAMLYGLLKKNYTLVFSFLAVILICLCIVFPLLRSTKNTIGHSVLSTQSAINFFHGHNPVARGSCPA